MKILFVTGASRSGTTMLCRIIGNHSSILGLNELHYFGDLCQPADAQEKSNDESLESMSAALLARQALGIWRGRVRSADYETARSIVKGLDAAEKNPAGVFAATLAYLTDEAGKEQACEQTPRNIFYAERLLAVFPDARIIYIVRDPRSVLASQKNRWRRKRFGGSNIPNRELVRVWINYHPWTMSKMWSRAADIGTALADHPRFLQIRYEDLTANPRECVVALCGFLRVPFEEGMLSIPRVGSSHGHNREQEKGIIHERGELWRDVLSSGEIAICEYVLRDHMKRYGYSLSLAEGQRQRLSVAWQLLLYPIHLLGVVAANPRRAWIQLGALLPGWR